MPTTPSASARLLTSLQPFVSFAWRVLLILLVFRIAFVIWQWQRVMDADMLLTIFVQGLRFDLVLLGLLLAIPVLCFPLFAASRKLISVWRGLLTVYLSLMLLIVLFLECSTPPFVNQFDSRPNILFLEYLKHPREVGSTLWAAYKMPIIATLLLVSAVMRISWRQMTRIAAKVEPVSVVSAVWLTPLLLVTCLGMARSTLDHRPVNPRTVARSTDPLVNELALNSTYTLLYAASEARHESQGGIRYGRMDRDSVVSAVRSGMSVPMEAFSSDELPTLHMQDVEKEFLSRPKNLVIVVEESLGAEFVGSLGGKDLTPNIDELSKEGIWFSNMYATGTRSVRGLEAIVTGFTPTPARSVVKLSKSQRGFFTLAQLLGDVGFTSSFIYGGEAQFDNMRRFFMNNGFDSVIDEKDYDDPIFVGSWGVSDEDLFNRAHDEFSKPHDKPFFSLVFTSSNHEPFQFPDGRIEIAGTNKGTVENAVRYADYALGKFVRRAQESDYWANTVFLIVADHNSRVYGSELVPIKRFHIPAMILGASITPSTFEPVASQIDLAPTLLSLIGVGGEHPMIGHDLTLSSARESPGRAIMQFNSTQAYMQGDRVAILQKDQPIQHFTYSDGQLNVAISRDADLAESALAHSIWSSMAYDQSLYRLP